jgi:ABC-type microcin C transport system permease subunit YejB
VEAAVVGLVGALVGILLTNILRVYFDWRNRSERVRDSGFAALAGPRKADIYRDYVAVQSGLLLIALIVMAVNLVVDVLYAVINPRIRVQ